MLILFLLFLIFIIYLSVLYFEKHCVKNFETELLLDQPRSMINEDFDLILTLINRKLMILPIIKIVLYFPNQIQLKNSKGERAITISASLLSYQKLRQRITCIGLERGIHEIKAELELSDLFGFAKHTITIDSISVIIHPNIKLFDSLINLYGSNEGEQIIERWLNPDPIFYTGHRPYTYLDPMKEIDWKASARLRELYVKQHDTTTDFKAVLCILIENNENLYMDNPSFIEAAINLSAFLIHKVAQSHLPVGLITNAATKRDFGSVFRPDSSENQIIRVFDTLACLTPYQQSSSLRTLQSIYEFMEAKQECFILANCITDNIINAIQAYLNKGIKPVLFLYQENDYELPNEVEVYTLKVGEQDETL